MKSDVRHEEQVRAFVEGCIERYKRIDIAFNNAGTIAPPKPSRSFRSMIGRTSSRPTRQACFSQ